MSGDENGVTTRTVTALSVADAIRSAPHARAGVLRRRRPVEGVALARHIIDAHPEAEPPSSIEWICDRCCPDPDAGEQP